MAYQQMANLYDQLMGDAPYDQWLAFTEEIFRQSGKTIQHVADLGCGTGQLTTRLAGAGFDTIGVDYSEDMLSYAQQRSSQENLTIQWIHQDLRELEGLTNLDAVVSYCDVINYITSIEELSKVFCNIHGMLKPKGIFIFDVHSIFHVQNNFVQQTFADVNDDISYIWFCTAGDDIGEMYHDLTFFVADGDKFARFEEAHHQQTYSIEVYKSLLTDAGFENINLYGDFSLKKESVYDGTERIFFVCEKRSGK
ncbi:class I SAM-dependent DNA methyltransferase [Virgibacillus oceani]|uniref:Methyltransferase YqeM n=1 Tax=Virgibacillus oceani TaxID=1479511 RepID=A0A917H040_9BACI|nr:class I SAM-dependent methyltransferase [Virgibacillus oceani]GGG63180.1 putative methyltransferase YqeM [Virgibacillus oceani]